jgi:hypothetical protein
MIIKITQNYTDKTEGKSTDKLRAALSVNNTGFYSGIRKASIVVVENK